MPQRIFRYCLPVFCLLFGYFTKAQPFTPVPLTGFNHDVVAETGTSSLTTTTFPLDGNTVSNKVMYTVGFRTTNSFGGGGIPDNGTITSGADSYQLSAYNAANALIVQRNQNADLNLATPARFGAIRILCFSTEGASLVNVRLHFSDGSTTNALTNYSLPDWFNNTANLVLQGYGRCTRSTPASGADAYPNNPRMYYMEVVLNCADKQKFLQKINFANVTTAGANAPYPNAVFLALSGRAYSQTIQQNITNATCTAGGSATLTVTGSTGPYTISWNTNPVQTGITATNLAAGNYQASITDAGGCVTTSNVTIPLTNNLFLNSANNSDTSICFGASFTTGFSTNATSFSWSPTTGVSNPAILNPVLSPAASTTYTLQVSSGSCQLQRSIGVTVRAPLAVDAGNNVSIFIGQSTQLNGTAPAGSYVWSPATALSATNILNPVATPSVTTTYTLRVTDSRGCTGSDTVTVTVIPYCLKVMEAFTPNGDGRNDRWLITNGSCLANARVRVYNRYGAPVYENNDYKNDWDGTYKGLPVPDGTYYYVVEYRLLNNVTGLLKGDVTILR